MKPMSKRPKHVLVVDDDVHVRSTLTLLLEAEGYRVTAVADAREALRFLAGAEPPAIILLDLNMPGMDGGAFLRERARARLYPAVPVVTMSGDLPQLEEPASWGVADHLVKPVPIEALLEVVRRHC
jgi:two-component system response regulator GlrR